MPLIDWSNKSTFDQWYEFGVEPDGHPNTRDEIRLGFCRAALMPYCQDKALKIKNILQFPVDARILIVGCGFGWLAECLEGIGYTQIIGIDTSTWIQNNKNTTEQVDVELAIKKAYKIQPSDPLTAEMLAHRERLWDGGVRTRNQRGILNNNMSTGKMRKDIQDILGGVDPDYALSDSVLESLTDNECTVVSNYAHQMTNNVYHIVQVAGQVDPAFNSKTLDEWKVLLPNDTFVKDSSFEVR